MQHFKPEDHAKGSRVPHLVILDKVIEAVEQFEQLHEESTGQKDVNFPLATLMDPFIRKHVV